MYNFDLVHLIGKNACAAASHVTHLVASEPACRSGDAWTMGALVVTAAALILVGVAIRKRRKLYRETYFR